ncbi:hypothetical protein BC829DRAFT_435306 [Chytridium lagenaria]|nr:hypothetical protein BC829DRAFT_435306 [Chytridium lagenaria]
MESILISTITHLAAFSSSRRHLSTTTHDHRFIDFSTCQEPIIPTPDEITVIPDFVSEKEEKMLVQAADARLRRLARGPYLEDHFDGVIKGYKEASISSWSLSEALAPADTKDVSRLMDRFRAGVNDALVQRGATRIERWLPPHVLELRDGDSCIHPHVDNLEASGIIVAVFLPARCMYFQRGKARYEYTHSIPMTSDPLHRFRDVEVERRRRICVMIRDEMKMTKL